MGAGTWVQSRGRREGEIPQHRVEILAGSHPSSSGAVLSIDRMEHPSPTRGTRRYPRYHSNLFRGQDAWDPHTHVLLSSQAPRPSPAEGERSPLGRVPFPCPTPAQSGTSHGPPVTSPLAQTLPLTANDLSQAWILGIQPQGPVSSSLAPAPCTPWFWTLREEIPMLDAGSGSELGLWVLGGQRSLTAAPPPPPAVLYPSGSSMENATTSSMAPPPAPPEPEPEPGISIVILLVYRTLGGLLPAQFQAERRGARYE